MKWLASIPAIIGLIWELIKFFKGVKKEERKKFLEDSKVAVEKLKEAKTEDEKLSAARNINDLIKRL